jgi:hypothetical protein
MDNLEQYRDLIESILIEHTKIPYAIGEINILPIFDRKRDHYVIMLEGWEKGKRVHGSLIHIDIINGKFWIQRDGTEYGVGNELLDAGIPKSQIVLAFRSINMRKDSDFAVA